MRRAILAFLGRFKKRSGDDREAAAAEREATEARRDALVEAQRRDITRG
ncbi:MAG TPA: hypothetical protein VFL61_13270 [Gaiellaceae bacterium]|nr:hypothetical protein [Gaiellaceae bacterium]